MVSLDTVSTTEVAERFRCSRQNVNDLFKRGQLEGPPRDPRGPIRIYVSSVQAYEERRSRTLTTPKVGSPVDSEAAPLILDAVERLERRVQELEKALLRMEARDDERSSTIADVDAIRSKQHDIDKLTLEAKLAQNEKERKEIEAQLLQQDREEMAWTLAKGYAVSTLPPGGEH